MSAGTAKPTTCPRCLGPLAYGHAGATRIFFFCSANGNGHDTSRFRTHRLRAAPQQQEDRAADGTTKRADQRVAQERRRRTRAPWEDDKARRFALVARSDRSRGAAYLGRRVSGRGGGLFLDLRSLRSRHRPQDRRRLQLERGEREQLDPRKTDRGKPSAEDAATIG